MFPCLGGDAEDAATAQALDALGEAHLKVLGTGVEGEQDGDLLALLQRLAGGLGGGNDEELDLSEAELVLGVVAADREDILDGGQDGLGDEGGAVGPLFNAAAEHAVESLGVEPSLPKLFLHEFHADHAGHL